jgi:hypothetical protein
MAWAKNYLEQRRKRRLVKVIDDKPAAPHQKCIRPRVGWLHIGRTRPQWRDAQKREATVDA